MKAASRWARPARKNWFYELLHQQPFRPFILLLADGRAFRVPHTNFISISRNGRHVIVEKKDNSFAIIDLPLIKPHDVSAFSLATVVHHP